MKRPVFDEHGQLIGWDVLRPPVFTVKVWSHGEVTPVRMEPERWVFEPLAPAIDRFH